MKNYQIFAAIFLGILGIKAFSKNDEGVFALTDEQKKTIENEGYKSEFIEAFNVALGKNFTDDPTEENQQEAEALDMETLRTMALQLANLQTELAQAQQQLEAMNADKTALEADKQNLQSKINGLTTQIETLKRSPEDDKGAGAQHSNGKGGQKMDILDDKQLMGMKGVMYSLEGRPYNQRARAALLAAHGYEVLIPKAENAGIDFSKLEEDLGAYYRQQRSQQLQSFIAQLPSVESIFPLESNIQDREVITNLFLGEFSQADSSNESDFDKVVKGKYELQPEEIRMYDVMMAFTFKNLKQLEKQWIGYLNREGSSSIKISFIEYLLQETAKKLHNEREQRRMKGVRKNPVVNVPGTAMEAADGYFRYIANKIIGLQIKPFELGEITESNIGEKVFQGTKQIPQELIDSGMMRLYMPSAMVVEYHKYNETKYGTNQDYQPNQMFVKEYPDVKIIELKNTGTHRRLVWTLEGNIKTFENIPGEMYNFRLKINQWSVDVTSQWKEGLGAILVGKKWDRSVDMDYNHQFIFCSDTDLASTEFLPMEKDATTPSALFHNKLVSVPNTSLKTITDILDLEVGKTVTLKCGSDNYGIKIDKSDKFSEITSAWTPGIGDTITLMKRQDGKFIELSRETAGNSALAFDANDTTPSVAGGTEFIIGDNTQATAITDLEDAIEGVIYTIYGKGTTYASTIANSGKFALTGAITLTTGTYIKLVKASDGKFHEVARG
jgi:Tfp pilus assembly protein PilN